MEAEYLEVKKIMKTSLRFSPYKPDKWLNLVIDGSATKGVGFVLFQWIQEGNGSKQQ